MTLIYNLKFLIIGFFWVPLVLLAENSQVRGTTMAEKRLAEIVNKEQSLFAVIKENPEKYSQSDLDFKVRSIIANYELYIADNPEDETAYILLGKLFRRVNRPEKANKLYLRADRYNPSIPVIKQQLANYYAEKGDLIKGNQFLKQALLLAPQEPLYHYQYGTFLFFYKEEILKQNWMSPLELEELMLSSFRMASKLDSNNRKYLERYAQSFYDVQDADWKLASDLWDELLENPDSELERQALKLHKARAVAELGDLKKAKYLLNQVKDDSLRFSKEELVYLIDKKELLKIERSENPISKDFPDSVVLSTETDLDSIILKDEILEESLEDTIARLKRKYKIETAESSDKETQLNEEPTFLETPQTSQTSSISQNEQLVKIRQIEESMIAESKNEIHGMPVQWPGFLEEERDAMEEILLNQIASRKELFRIRFEMKEQFESLLNHQISIHKGEKIEGFTRISKSYESAFTQLNDAVALLVDKIGMDLNSLLRLKNHLLNRGDYVHQKGWDISRVKNMIKELINKNREAAAVFEWDFERALNLQVNLFKAEEEYFDLIEGHNILTSLAFQ